MLGVRRGRSVLDGKDQRARTESMALTEPARAPQCQHEGGSSGEKNGVRLAHAFQPPDGVVQQPLPSIAYKELHLAYGKQLSRKIRTVARR